MQLHRMSANRAPTWALRACLSSSSTSLCVHSPSPPPHLPQVSASRASCLDGMPHTCKAEFPFLQAAGTNIGINILYKSVTITDVNITTCFHTLRSNHSKLSLTLFRANAASEFICSSSHFATSSFFSRHAQCSAVSPLCIARESVTVIQR